MISVYGRLDPQIYPQKLTQYLLLKFPQLQDLHTVMQQTEIDLSQRIFCSNKASSPGERSNLQFVDKTSFLF